MATSLFLSSLVSSNTYLPPLVDQKLIVRQLWGNSVEFEPVRFSRYFTFYVKICREQSWVKHAIKTHQDSLDVVQYVKTNKDRTKNEIRTTLGSSLGRFASFNHDQIDESLNLAFRLWLLVSFRGPQSFVPGQTALYWSDQESYVDVLERIFPRITGVTPGKLQVSQSLTACNVVQLGGFTIKWTWNLVDHLMITQGEEKVLVICHAMTVLEALATSNDLPPGLAEETIHTLGMLFPSISNAANQWLKKETAQIKDEVDPGIGNMKPASLNIENFTFWRQRLLVLQDSYDKAEPETLWQWWHDKRKKRDWATFWVAFLVLILTITFGLISSITGIIQATYTVKAYNAPKDCVSLCR